MVVLPEPVGPGDQHHAVRLGDVAAELRQIALAEADHVERELRELLAHRFFIEHAKHGVFAVNRGHDRDAEIDQAALVAHAETAVLRHAALGDIQLAHDLDARNDRGVPVLRDGRHGVMQHAVDAVLDDHFLIARLDVDIARAPFERVEDRGVDQLDDRRDIAVARGQAVDGKRLVRVLFVAHDVEREAFGDFFQNALRLLGLLQQIGDLRSGGHLHPQLLVQQQAQFVDRVEIARIGQRDFERSVLRPQRHEVVAEHQVHRERGTGRDRSTGRADRRIRSGSAPAMRAGPAGELPSACVLAFSGGSCAMVAMVQFIGSYPPARRSADTAQSARNATNMPMKIMMAGSISESTAVIRVFTSSS